MMMLHNQAPIPSSGMRGSAARAFATTNDAIYFVPTRASVTSDDTGQAGDADMGPPPPIRSPSDPKSTVWSSGSLSASYPAATAARDGREEEEEEESPTCRFFALSSSDDMLRSSDDSGLIRLRPTLLLLLLLLLTKTPRARFAVIDIRPRS